MTVKADRIELGSNPYNTWPPGYVVGTSSSGKLLLEPNANYILKYWNGAAWVPVLTRLKMWNGGAWVLETRKVKVFYAGQWIQINPNYP